MQSQTNSYDCGVFAIANVISLVNDICPCRIEYDISQMRTHLFEIYSTKRIDMFPTINVYDSHELSEIVNPNEQRQIQLHRWPIYNTLLEISQEDLINIKNKIQHDLIIEQVSLSKKVENNNKINILNEVNSKIDKLQCLNELNTDEHSQLDFIILECDSMETNGESVEIETTFLQPHNGYENSQIQLGNSKLNNVTVDNNQQNKSIVDLKTHNIIKPIQTSLTNSKNNKEIY